MMAAWQRPGVTRRFWARLQKGAPPGVGALSWIAHRITGLVLLGYLFLHIYTLGAILQGPAPFETAMALMARPAVRLLELALVWVVLFHALNGVRLILLHLVPAANHRTLAFAVGATTVVLGVASLPLFLR